MKSGCMGRSLNTEKTEEAESRSSVASVVSCSIDRYGTRPPRNISRLYLRWTSHADLAPDAPHAA